MPSPRPLGSRALHLAALIASLVFATSACNHAKKAPPSLDISAPQQSLDAIPTAPVSGKIHGAAFRIGDARYTIDQRRGYEKLDIVLSAGTASDRCAATSPADSPAVWLRHPGEAKVEPTKATLTPRGGGPWEVHYQVREKEGWRGNGDAAALLAIKEVRPDRTIAGDLSVCFADDEKSCVSGTFEAHYCPISIDAPVRGVEPLERAPEKAASKTPAPPSSAATPPTGDHPR